MYNIFVSNYYLSGLVDKSVDNSRDKGVGGVSSQLHTYVDCDSDIELSN